MFLVFLIGVISKDSWDEYYFLYEYSYDSLREHILIFELLVFLQQNYKSKWQLIFLIKPNKSTKLNKTSKSQTNNEGLLLIMESSIGHSKRSRRM